MPTLTVFQLHVYCSMNTLYKLISTTRLWICKGLKEWINTYAAIAGNITMTISLFFKYQLTSFSLWGDELFPVWWWCPFLQLELSCDATYIIMFCHNTEMINRFIKKKCEICRITTVLKVATDRQTWLRLTVILAILYV